MQWIETVTRLVEDAVEGLGLEVGLLDVQGSRRVRLIIDRDPGGVTLEDCVAVSRAVETALEPAGFPVGSFHLEVMSPGVNRLLTREKDFRRFAGSPVRVTLKEKRDGRRNFSGDLEGLAGDAVVIRATETGEATRFPRPAIKEVRLVEDPTAARRASPPAPPRSS